MEASTITRENTNANPLDFQNFIMHPNSTLNKKIASDELQSFLGASTPLSRTEQQLRSHNLINQILNSCRLKVVNHQMRTPYASHKNSVQKLSYSHQKVKTEATALKQRANIRSSCNSVSGVVAEMQENRGNNKNKRAARACGQGQSDQRKHSHHISISGLLSYEFKSVRSRTRLLLDAITPENSNNQRFLISETTSNSRQRRQKGRAKSEQSQVVQNIDDIMSSVKEKETPTFLKKLLREKRNSQVVYGQPSQKYSQLKDMTRELQDVDQACSVMNEIRKFVQPQCIIGKCVAPKGRLAKRMKFEKDVRVFQQRKQPSSVTRVCVSRPFCMEDQ